MATTISCMRAGRSVSTGNRQLWSLLALPRSRCFDMWTSLGASAESDLARLRQVTKKSCPGTLIEQSEMEGECARGDDCEVLELLDHYQAYRLAHAERRPAWLAAGEAAENEL